MSDAKLDRAIELEQNYEVLSDGCKVELDDLIRNNQLNWLRRLRLAEGLLSRLVTEEGWVCVEEGRCPGCVHEETIEGYQPEGCEYVEWRKLRKESQDGE